jgi:hypothetical protein
MYAIYDRYVGARYVEDGCRTCVGRRRGTALMVMITIAMMT